MPDIDLSPVSSESSDADSPAPALALCLSGGGYRAMLFHAGVLWRLAELGYLGSTERQGKHGLLGSLQRVSSVSGGSITSAVLALAWPSLEVDGSGLPERFRRQVIDPVQCFASQSTISIGSGLWAALVSTINKRIVKVYRKKLYGEKTLQHLPDHPRFIFNATNLQSGALWRFSKTYSRDWRVGEIKTPNDSIASVIAASSAFPPFLSPACFKYNESAYTADSGADLQRPPYTTRPVLSDGGVYDNLGLETAYKRFRTLIVSDAGGTFKAADKVHGDWARQSYRVLNTIDNQVRSLRKRQLLAALTRQERLGTFFSIRGDIAKYPVPDKLDCPLKRTQALASIATDLAAKDVATQRRLINWGYAICDGGVRAWVEDGLPPPSDFPFPAEGV